MGGDEAWGESTGQITEALVNQPKLEGEEEPARAVK